VRGNSERERGDSYESLGRCCLSERKNRHVKGKGVPGFTGFIIKYARKGTGRKRKLY